MRQEISRRNFVRLGLCAAAALGLAGCSYYLDTGDEEPGETESDPPLQTEPEEGQKDVSTAAGKELREEPAPVQNMPRRYLGNTGCAVSILGLGGSFILARAEQGDEAEKVIHRALDLGINYIDTAPTYGSSETNIGRVAAVRRGEIFLAGKTIERGYDQTMRLFEQSLERLQTDYLDLLQVHGLHSLEDLERILAPGGTMTALEKLKQSGAVRFLGVTGHKEPQVLLKAINEYDFDTILLPVNPADPFYQPMQEKLLPATTGKQMGVIAMKVAAYGRIFRQGGLESIEQALTYALSFPVNTAIIGVSSVDELEENARIARDFKPLPAKQLRHLEELVEPYQEEVNFFKTKW